MSKQHNQGEFFSTKSISVLDSRYFKESKTTTNRQVAVHFPAITNLLFENEMRGFIQHLVKDKHYTPSGVVNTFNSLKVVIRFINEKHPDCDSVIDFNYEEIYKDYLEYLEDKNIKAKVERRLTKLNGDMDWVYCNIQTSYDTWITKFYNYILAVVYPDNRREYDKDIFGLLGISVFL